MKIERLREIIEQNKYNNASFIINNIDNCPFLAHQYIHHLTLSNNLQSLHVDNISEIPTWGDEGFLSMLESNYFYIYYTDKLDELSLVSTLKRCCIIYTGRKIKDVEKIKEYIVDIPKVELWQIKDYTYSRGKGIDIEDLDRLLELTDHDLWRLEKELDKIEIFEEKYRKDLFKQFIADGTLGDLIPYNSFNFVSAIIKRQKAEAVRIYEELKNTGINHMGIIALLYNNFRNIIKIQLSPNPTPENAGLKSNQFWAIKKNNIGYYTKEELMYIFGFLTNIDRQIKMGEIEVEKSIEYLLVHILQL